MTVKRIFKIVLTVFLVSIVFFGCSFFKDNSKSENNDSEKIDSSKKNINTLSNETQDLSEKYGEKIPVSRALAAKMITLSFNEKTDINAYDKEINFKDVDEEQWYFPYINTAYIQGYMKGENENFNPLEPLSLSEAQILLNKINVNNKTRIKITDETKNQPISFSLWNELFQKELNEVGQGKELSEAYGIKEVSLIVVSTPGNSEIEPWAMSTDKGIYYFSGYNMDAYADKKVKLFIKGNEVVSVVSIENNSPVLTNAFVVEKSKNKLKISMGGILRTYFCDETIPDFYNSIADVKLENGYIKELKTYSQTVSGIVKKISSGNIEFDENKIYALADDIKIYEAKGGAVYWKGLQNLICGTDIADFYLKDDKICAAVIKRTVEPEKIRVVLSKSGFEGYVHENVILTSDEEFVVESNGNKKEMKKDELIEISKENDNNLFENGRIYVYPKSENGFITIKSIEKSSYTPKYRGIIEIEKREDGFVIVNEVDIEKYLYSVVPSEMPSSYGIEASKVQAVTARSYAFNQFYANKYYGYGANVDDSTMCQVYNNIGENDISIKAVDETKGLCLTYKNTVISANFFSTSCGVTANSGEVWANTSLKKFPSENVEYLRAVKNYSGTDYGPLFIEENAAKFFKSNDVNSFDSHSSWFRWNVRLSKEELTQTVNKNLKAAYDRNKFLILTKQSDGKYKSTDISEIGEIKDIFVNKRGEGGNVMELIITGTKETVKVMTEYNVRTVLKPIQYIDANPPIEITCGNGGTVSNYALMPSAFFVLDKEIDESGNLISVTFYGGGNGHGVGMSQNGVKGMIDEGYNFSDILKHYYNGSEVKKIY